jgi:uncharacterized membrane protein YtjA (UPF0391 family)
MIRWALFFLVMELTAAMVAYGGSSPGTASATGILTSPTRLFFFVYLTIILALLLVMRKRSKSNENLNSLNEEK